MLGRLFGGSLIGFIRMFQKMSELTGDGTVIFHSTTFEFLVGGYANNHTLPFRDIHLINSFHTRHYEI